MGKSTAQLVLSMLVFGTIGLFRRLIPLSSAMLSLCRGLIGGAFLVLFMKIRGMPIRFRPFRKELPVILLSGVLIGFNWIFLFEAYNYTTVATATLCYYMAPVILLVVSPFLFGERMTLSKLLCILAAVIGMFLISTPEAEGTGDIRGVLFGLAAAALYATVIVLNKRIRLAGVYERTFLQLFTAALVTIPYELLTAGLPKALPDARTVLIVLIVGIVHTGISYVLYFDSVNTLPAYTVAIFSYIDPLTAVLLSTLFLKEPLTVQGAIGMVLILGSTLLSEGLERRKTR